METVIKITPAELNLVLLDKIRAFIGEKANVDITIALKDIDEDYAITLNRSIEQATQGDVVSFSMEAFMNYTPTVKN